MAVNKPTHPTNINSTIASRHEEITMSDIPGLSDDIPESFDEIANQSEKLLDLLLAPFQEDRYDIDDTNFNIILLRRLAQLQDKLFMRRVPTAKENMTASFDNQGQVKDSGIGGVVSFSIPFSQFNPTTAWEFDNRGLTAAHFDSIGVMARDFNWHGLAPEQFDSVPEGYHLSIYDPKDEVSPGIFRCVDIFYKLNSK